MSRIPERPKIYHILHVDRLPSVLTEGGLWCDAEMQYRKDSGTTIGMDKIKQRRLVLPVPCHPGDYVGDYVPFYFCPRSIMLYIIHTGNNSDLAYKGGQGPILHLQADLERTIDWAEKRRKRWAFTLSNAGAYYTEFRSRLDQISEINWPAVVATDFRSRDVKEGKQAEFLLHNFFPWNLVERIGVCTSRTRDQVVQILQSTMYQTSVEMLRSWYY